MVSVSCLKLSLIAWEHICASHLFVPKLTEKYIYTYNILLWKSKWSKWILEQSTMGILVSAVETEKMRSPFNSIQFYFGKVAWHSPLLKWYGMYDGRKKDRIGRLNFFFAQQKPRGSDREVESRHNSGITKYDTTTRGQYGSFEKEQDHHQQFSQTHCHCHCQMTNNEAVTIKFCSNEHRSPIRIVTARTFPNGYFLSLIFFLVRLLSLVLWWPLSQCSTLTLFA